MKKLALIAVLLAACGGKKDKPEGKETPPTTGTAAGSGSATAGAGSGSAPAPAGSGSAAGSGSDTMAAGSGSGSGSSAGSGSAVADDGIKFDKLPDGWDAGGGKLDTFEAVNDSKFPVDNASFVFEYSVEAKDMPTDPKEYAAVLDKGGFKVT